MLNRVIPIKNLIETHPLFRRETRGASWRQSAQHVKRFTIKWLALAIAVLVGLWVLSLLGTLEAQNIYLTNTTTNNAYYYSPPIIDTSSSFLAWAALISIGANLLLDFVSLWVSMTAIGGEVSAGRWDLLRLTSLREDGIVEAKHALAQLRAWRITLIVVGLRLGLVIILALHGFVLLPLFGNGGDIFGYADVGTGVVLYTTLAIFFAVYIFEPLWRMRTQTALGMMVSTYTRSVVYAALGSLGMLIAVLVVQALIIAAIGFVISVLTRGFGYTSQLSSMCFILVVCSATAVIIYMFYRTVGEWALGRTTRRAFIAD